MTTTASDVVVIGAASWNTIVTLDALPDPVPHTTAARRHLDCLGGTSAGKGLHLALLGVDTSVLAMVGGDDAGAAIADALRVPYLHAHLIRGVGPSERHLNLMTPAGERVSIYLDHAPEPILPRTLATDLAGARAVAVDLMPLGRAALTAARASGAWLWTDLHDYDGRNPYHQDFRDAADVVLLNDDGCAREGLDPWDLLADLVAGGANAAICTLGERGAIGLTAAGERVAVPAEPVEVVDTNGAGDAFMAGALARALHDGVDRRGGPDRFTEGSLRAAMRAGAHQATAALRVSTLAPAP